MHHGCWCSTEFVMGHDSSCAACSFNRGSHGSPVTGSVCSLLLRFQACLCPSPPPLATRTHTQVWGVCFCVFVPCGCQYTRYSPRMPVYSVCKWGWCILGWCLLHTNKSRHKGTVSLTPLLTDLHRPRHPTLVFHSPCPA